MTPYLLLQCPTKQPSIPFMVSDPSFIKEPHNSERTLQALSLPVQTSLQAMSYLPDLQEVSYKLFSGPGYNHHLPGPRITGISRLPSPLPSQQVNPIVLYGKLSPVISSVQVDNLPCQSVYISSPHWMHTSLSRLSFCNCSAPCVCWFCHCCQSDITFGLRDGDFISSSHRAPPAQTLSKLSFREWITEGL